MKNDKTLINLFEKNLIDSKKKFNYKSENFKFYPSMLGSNCLRKIFYSYTKVEEDYPMDISGLKICHLGDYIHNMFKDCYRKLGILIDYPSEDKEFPIKDAELSISGKIDAVFKIDNKIWIGEFKSINSFNFNKLKEPKLEHKYQGYLYVILFSKLLKEGFYKDILELQGFEKIEGIKFLYLNKDTSNIKEFSIKIDDDDIETIFLDLVEKIMEVKSFNETQKLPPKTENFCNYCSYREKCSKNLLK